MEQVVSDLVSNIDRERFNPLVVCINSIGQIGEELQKKDIAVIKLPRMLPLVSYLFPYQLVKIIRQFKADVIHVHSGCWHKVAIAGRWCGVRKIIYTDHGRFFPDLKKVIFLDRVASVVTERIVAVSQNLGEYMTNVVGIPKPQMSVIINGIDVERFRSSRISPRGGRCSLGIIARLEPVKDIPTLLQSMKLVLQRYPDVSLIVVGEGGEKEYLLEVANRLGISESVDFLGCRRDIPLVLKDIDIFVLSSLSEGTSITLLEAMAAGKPVVVTNVGGNPAIVADGINGFLVPPREPETMANALVRLIEDSSLRTKMGEANTKKVSDSYSVLAMTEQYQRLYD